VVVVEVGFGLQALRRIAAAVSAGVGRGGAVAASASNLSARRVILAP
jgi:hypothetical protein